MKHKIAPLVLSANFLELQKDIAMINYSEADWFHVDVMDGRFVPNISFGMMIIDQMKTAAQKPLDVHLMIVEPEKYITEFRKAGADNITIHLEACTHLHRTIDQIKSTGARAGVALNPHTSVSLLEDVLENLDLICLMSVNPGFGGQKFIYQTLPKIRKLRAMLDERNLDTLIEIDGGVGFQNAQSILEAGADVLVAGNSVFGAKDPVLAISQLKNLDGSRF